MLQEPRNCTNVTVVFMAENGRVDRSKFSLQRLWQKKSLLKINKRDCEYLHFSFTFQFVKSAVMSSSQIACPLHVNETVKNTIMLKIHSI